jgi:hypothetical protein
MKDYRFYLEYPNATEKRKSSRKNLGEHSGNCIAVYLPTIKDQYLINHCFECASGVFSTPNSPINWGAVGPEYLAKNCKRIPEKQAKEIHPALFDYLETPNFIDSLK